MDKKHTAKQSAAICALSQAAVHKAVSESLVSLDITHDEASEILGHADALVQLLGQAAHDAILKLRHADPFADEETRCVCEYGNGYEPAGIDEQIATLKTLFPVLAAEDVNMDFSQARDARQNGSFAENWFAIPNWRALAPNYREALVKVFGLIKNAHGGVFHECTDGRIGPENLQESAHKAQCIEKIAAHQGSQILLVPAQFGMLHRGRSVRRACALMDKSEFGLGAFEIGCMLLTHPKRLANEEDLWLDCAGDQWRPTNSGGFGGAPYFSFTNKRVRFDCRRIIHHHAHCGTVSAFCQAASRS